MSQRTYHQVWEEEWKHICTNKDGTLNLDQIQRELSDYSFMLGEVPKVYSEVAGLSKPNTHAKAVISEYEKLMNEKFKDYIDEIIHDLVEEIEEPVWSDDGKAYRDGLRHGLSIIKRYVEG